MAKVKAVTFHTDFCELGEIKYVAGNSYAQNADTDRCVTLNFGFTTSVDSTLVSPPPISAADAAVSDEAAAQAAALAASMQLAADQAAAQAAADQLVADQAAINQAAADLAAAQAANSGK
jgi:hypothetical protein